MANDILESGKIETPILTASLTKIKKRDGRIADFHAQKIVSAVEKAGKATGEFDAHTARYIALRVINLAQQMIFHDIPTVEEVQDIVEEVLLSSQYKKTAKAYIIYREQHAKIREIVSGSSIDLVDNYLDKIDWQVKENSNMSYSLQGLQNYISSEINKIYWLNKIYNKKIARSTQYFSLNSILSDNMSIHSQSACIWD